MHWEASVVRKIYLRPKQERALRFLASRQHVSLSELIRRSVDHNLAEALPADQDPSLGLIGLGHSRRFNLSAPHGAPIIHVSFARAVGETCPVPAQCTWVTSSGRKLTLRPQAEHGRRSGTLGPARGRRRDAGPG